MKVTYRNTVVTHGSGQFGSTLHTKWISKQDYEKIKEEGITDQHLRYKTTDVLEALGIYKHYNETQLLYTQCLKALELEPIKWDKVFVDQEELDTKASRKFYHNLWNLKKFHEWVKKVKVMAKVLEQPLQDYPRVDKPSKTVSTSPEEVDNLGMLLELIIPPKDIKGATGNKTLVHEDTGDFKSECGYYSDEVIADHYGDIFIIKSEKEKKWVKENYRFYMFFDGRAYAHDEWDKYK